MTKRMPNNMRDKVKERELGKCGWCRKPVKLVLFIYGSDFHFVTASCRKCLAVASKAAKGGTYRIAKARKVM